MITVYVLPKADASGAPGGVRPALLIDSSTIDPPTARDMVAAVTASSLHKDARPCHGCSAAHPSLVDAPVSGGITGASKATLTFMVSPAHLASEFLHNCIEERQRYVWRSAICMKIPNKSAQDV